MRSLRTTKLHLPSSVTQICRFESTVGSERTSTSHVPYVLQSLGRSCEAPNARPRGHRQQRHTGLGYKPETSSATISAAGCGCRASATLCPAHNEHASISPVVPTIGAAGS